MDEFLSSVRKKAYTEYEDSLVGPYMSAYKTFLKLNFSCDDIEEKTFKEIVRNVKSGVREFDIIVDTLFNCIINNLPQNKPIKADLKADSDYFNNGKLIFPFGSLFEVKMMDVESDSYLSEFFSIFKQSETIEELKLTHLDIYNKIITKLYKKLKTSEIAQQFLDNIKNNIAGIFFDKNIVVPIEYINIYWSDKGQKLCKEKRLSIRFKIVDKNVVSYIYDKNSTELKINSNPINVVDFTEINCD